MFRRMMMTTAEIQAEFAALSSISWDDYVELCRNEVNIANYEEARRAGHIDDDEWFVVARTVEDNHWAYGSDWGQPRLVG